MKFLSSTAVKRGIMLVTWMGVIFLFSSLHGSGIAEDPPLRYLLERKGAHVFEYAVLMLLAVRFAVAAFPKQSIVRIFSLAFVFALSYGATDELHQLFVPNRGAKMTDVLIDGLGAFIMLVILLLAKAFSDRNK